MIRKITSTLFAIVLLVLIGMGYLYYKQVSKPKNPLVTAIPVNAGVILRTKNITNSLIKIQKSGIVKSIKQLTLVKTIGNDLIQIDSLLNSNKINYNVCTFSLHNVDSSYNWLGVFEINEEAKFSLSIGQYENQIEIKVGPNGVYYFLHNKLLVAAKNKKLLLASKNQIESKTGLLQIPNFNRLYTSIDEHSEANLFVNYVNYANFIKASNVANRELLSGKISSFGNWSELDINSSTNSILFNGYSSCSSNSVLNYFENQDAQNMSLTNLLPVNTASFYYFSFDDFTSYHNKRITNNKEQYLKYLEKTEQTYGVALEDFFLSWIGNEICMGYQKNDAKDKVANSFAIIKSKDANETKHVLALLVKELSNKMKFELESKLYRGYEIGFLNLKDILPNIMGEYFDEMDYNFFTIIDDYVVFTTNYRTSQSIIDHYYKKQTLNYNPDFISLKSKLEKKSNLFFYYNIPLSKKEITELVPQKFKSEFNKNFSNFKNIESACIQITSEKELFYTVGLVNYNPEYKEIDIDKWQLKLDAKVENSPQLIKNKNTNQQELLVVDVENNLYLISLDGKLIFKTKLDSRILGKIETIDFYKDGRTQFIFNTANKLYVIDKAGKNIEYYPVKFKVKATNGLSVFDYDSTKNYRFVLATENNEIINLTREAKLTKGWSKYKVKNKVTQPIIHFVSKEKDYIVATDILGKNYFINRRGKKNNKTEIPLIEKTQLYLNIDSLSRNSTFKVLPYATTDTTLTHVISGNDSIIYSYRIK